MAIVSLLEPLVKGILEAEEIPDEVSEESKKIYISGDGAARIKNGEKYLDKALFCADKYHLMKYINKAAGQLLDEKDIAKEELWHIFYSKSKDSKKKFDEYTSKIYASVSNKKVVEELRSYVPGNWAAVRRTLRNKHVNGCSAESHVPHISTKQWKVIQSQIKQ